MSKPVLFLLPGLICDARIWQDQISALGGSHDVRVPNFYGFDSLSGMAQTVLDDAPERFAVAGHSMGARVALEVLALAPERVERIALLDTGAHPPAAGEAARRQVLVDLINAKGMEAAVEAWLRPMIHPDRLGDAAFMDDMAAMVRRASPAIFEKQVHALLNRPDGFTRLPLITVPCAMIVGRQDSWSPPEQHEAMRGHVPHAVLTVVDDSGHMAPAERPGAVNVALHAWLAS